MSQPLSRRSLSRRTLLKGVGASLSLPWLEAMSRRSVSAAETTKFPLRFAALYVPNGKNMAHWTPTAEGTDFELPSILQPLSAVRKKLLVLTGLTADKARANGDGGGDHARALAAFLTGCQPRKTDGADIRAGVSVDQVMASRVGDRTRLPSLEIGCDRGAMAGNCDSGYSCVYSSTISWRSATTPVPKEVDPKLVFERLFSSGSDADRAKRDARRKSILDFVRDDAQALTKQLGVSDRRKMDEYLTSVRDIEQRIERARALPEVKMPDMAKPTGVPKAYAEHLKLMADLLVLAFQTDVTRVSTFVFANEGSNRSYPEIGVSDGHHSLSHHGRDAAKLQKIAKINTFHVEHLAYLLEKLEGVREGEESLLDHCMICYGSGNSDGDRHNHDDLPIILAGGGNGTINPGRHIRYAKETPLNNLWLAMLDRMGSPLSNLGDSTGVLTRLDG